MTHVLTQVLCLGEVLFDSISDEPGVELDCVTAWTQYPGGAPANVACALRKLGTSAGFIGAIGQDAMGAELLEVLRSHSVDLSGVQLIPGMPTRSVLVTRDITGDRTFAAFGGNRSSNSFADTRLNAAHISSDLFESVQYLVTGTLLLAYPESAAAVTYAIDLAKQAGVQIVVDVNWRSVFWEDERFAKSCIQDVLLKADYLKLTDEEADWLFGSRNLLMMRDRFPQLKAILMTRGEHGCAYWVPEGIGEVSAFRVDVEDTTGAGDSFLAGFLHQLCQRKIDGTHGITAEIAKEMVIYASAAGALTTLRRGAIAASPTATEITAFLHLGDRIKAVIDPIVLVEAFLEIT
jgi:fructokinase